MEVASPILVALCRKVSWPSVLAAPRLDFMELIENTSAATHLTHIAIREVGYYNTVAFDDPAITATVRNLGGWLRLCEMEVEEFEKWLRPNFERVYKGLRLTGVSNEQASPLLGFFDLQNGGNGHDRPTLRHVATGIPAAKLIDSPPQLALRGPAVALELESAD